MLPKVNMMKSYIIKMLLQKGFQPNMSVIGAYRVVIE